MTQLRPVEHDPFAMGGAPATAPADFVPNLSFISKRQRPSHASARLVSPSAASAIPISAARAEALRS